MPSVLQLTGAGSVRIVFQEKNAGSGESGAFTPRSRS
jgi:hypothetical protein